MLNAYYVLGVGLLCDGQNEYITNVLSFKRNDHAFHYYTTECVKLLNLLFRSLFTGISVLLLRPRKKTKQKQQQQQKTNDTPPKKKKKEKKKKEKDKGIKLFWTYLYVLPINETNKQE